MSWLERMVLSKAFLKVEDEVKLHQDIQAIRELLDEKSISTPASDSSPLFP